MPRTKDKSSGKRPVGKFVGRGAKLVEELAPLADLAIPGAGLVAGGAARSVRQLAKLLPFTDGPQPIRRQQQRALAGSRLARNSSRPGAVSEPSATIGTRTTQVQTGSAKEGVMLSPYRREFLAEIGPQVGAGGIEYTANISAEDIGDWARNLAVNFETYGLLHVDIEYVPYNSAFEAGAITMAIQPDPSKPAPGTEQDVMDLQGSKTSPVRGAMWIRVKAVDVETLGSRRFVGARGYGAVPEDGSALARQDSFGTVYVWVSGCGIDDPQCGKLFVTYQWEFFTPTRNSVNLRANWFYASQSYHGTAPNYFSDTDKIFDPLLAAYYGTLDSVYISWEAEGSAHEQFAYLDFFSPGQYMIVFVNQYGPPGGTDVILGNTIVTWLVESAGSGTALLASTAHNSDVGQTVTTESGIIASAGHTIVGTATTTAFSGGAHMLRVFIENVDPLNTVSISLAMISPLYTVGSSVLRPYSLSNVSIRVIEYPFDELLPQV